MAKKRKLLAKWLTAVTFVITFYLMLGFSEEDAINFEDFNVRSSDVVAQSFDALDINSSQPNTGTALEVVPTSAKHDLVRRTLNDEEWDAQTCFGQGIMRIQDQPSFAAAVEFTQRKPPAWTARLTPITGNPGYVQHLGWQTVNDEDAIKNLHITRLRPMLEHYSLSTNPTEWTFRTTRHRGQWRDNEGNVHNPSNGFFSFLINKRASRATMIWTAMFSPAHMIARMGIDTIEPPLKFASDLYYLEFYRYWSVDRPWNNANPAGESPMPPIRYIIIRSIHEPTIVDFFRSFKENDNDQSPRVGGRKWPGEKYTRADDQFFIVISSPMGQAVTWFLAQHKHIFGARSVSRVRIWASSDDEDDFNLIFEINSSPDPEVSSEEEGDAIAGADPPPPEKRALGDIQTITTSLASRAVDILQESRQRRRQLRQARRARGLLHRRVEDDATWNSWLRIGRAMYDLMTASDTATAEDIAQKHPVLTKWRGKTGTQWNDPSSLTQYGWSITAHPIAEAEAFDVDDSVSGSGIPTDDVDDWVELHTRHAAKWKSDDGEEHAPTTAEFEAYYLRDAANPAIILGLAISPWYATQMSGSKVALPPLQKMSDLIFLTYYEFWRKMVKYPHMAENGGSKIPTPKYIFVKDIQEEHAVEKVFPAIGRRSGHEMPKADGEEDTTYFGNWPGVTIKPQDDGYCAILSTKQGRGIAAFLFNHKQELGAKRVKTITIWHSESEGSYFLRFEIEDSPAPKPQLARRTLGKSVDDEYPIIEPMAKRHDSLDLGMGNVKEGVEKDTRLTNVTSQVIQPLHLSRRGRTFLHDGRNLRLRRRAPKEKLEPATSKMMNEWRCTGEFILEFLAAKTVAEMDQIVDRRRLSKWKGRLTSSWVDFEKLRENGWDPDHIDDEEFNDLGGVVDGGFTQILEREQYKLSKDTSKWSRSNIAHLFPYKDRSGKEQPSSEGEGGPAVYTNIYYADPELPAMIIEQQWSPSYMDKKRGVVRDPPALSKWSDVTFLTWENFWHGRDPKLTKVPCPKLFIIDNVQNDDAKRAFLKLVEQVEGAHEFPPRFPGVYFNNENAASAERFKMFMGLPQGMGIAMFLLQYKQVFGAKTVERIVWSMKEKAPEQGVQDDGIMTVDPDFEDGNTLIFEIADVGASVSEGGLSNPKASEAPAPWPSWAVGPFKARL